MRALPFSIIAWTFFVSGLLPAKACACLWGDGMDWFAGTLLLTALFWMIWMTVVIFKDIWYRYGPGKKNKPSVNEPGGETEPSNGK